MEIPRVPFPYNVGYDKAAVEYVAIRLVSKPLAMAFGPNTHGNQNWQSNTNRVVAYAEDITLLVTAPNDIPALAETLWRYEKATGACLNIWKSKAMAAGSWKRQET